MSMVVEKILVDAIEVAKGRRVIDPNWIEALAEDIKARGQQTPIEVVKGKTGYRLISGNHRLNAIKRNFGQEVFAIVKEPKAFASEAEIRLAEIAENFMRRELTVLDRAQDVAAWREIFEATQGVIKRGGDRRSKQVKKNQSVKPDTLIAEPGKNSSVELCWGMPNEAIEAISANFALSFTEAAQGALNLSQKGVFRALKISTIAQKVRDAIALFAIANNQSELLALAAQPAEKQGPISQLIISGQAVNVAMAITIIDKLPAPPKVEVWEKLFDGFSKLKEREQDRFFDLNRAAIERWMAK